MGMEKLIAETQMEMEKQMSGKIQKVIGKMKMKMENNNGIQMEMESRMQKTQQEMEMQING